MRTILVATAMAMLGGCLSTPHQQAVPLASDYHAVPVEHAHAVRFRQGDIVVSEVEQLRLQNFLLTVRPDVTDTVTVTAGGPTALSRSDMVAAVLAEQGVFVAERAHDPRSLPTVTVTVSRETLVPVRCQPGAVPLFDPRRPVSPPGCANDLALVRMIADPRDLTTGSPAGPADGSGGVLAIERYREGDITPLQDLGGFTE